MLSSISVTALAGKSSPLPLLRVPFSLPCVPFAFSYIPLAFSSVSLAITSIVFSSTSVLVTLPHVFCHNWPWRLHILVRPEDQTHNAPRMEPSGPNMRMDDEAPWTDQVEFFSSELSVHLMSSEAIADDVFGYLGLKLDALIFLSLAWDRLTCQDRQRCQGRAKVCPRNRIVIGCSSIYILTRYDC